MLKSFLVTSLAQVLMRSGLQMGALVPRWRESPMRATRLPFFPTLVLVLHLLQGLSGSHLGGRTCTNASSSLFSHTPSATPRAPYLPSSGSWEGRQTLLSLLCRDLLPPLRLPRLLPLPKCSLDAGPAAAVSECGPLIDLSPFQAPRCFSSHPAASWSSATRQSSSSPWAYCPCSHPLSWSSTTDWVFEWGHHEPMWVLTTWRSSERCENVSPPPQ